MKPPRLIVDGLPQVVDCSTVVRGLVETPADLQQWHDALSEPHVAANFFRDQEGEIRSVMVRVEGRLDRPCDVSIAVYGDAAKCVAQLLDTGDDVEWWVYQAVSADDVWAALTPAEASRP